MSHVFISFAAEDTHIADSVCVALEAAGLQCWIAPRDVQPGEEFALAVSNAIDQSGLLLLLLSTHSQQSRFVEGNVTRAHGLGKAIVVFRIEGAAGAGWPLLQGINFLDALTPPLETHLRRLVNVVLEHMKGEQRSAPAPGSSSAEPTETSSPNPNSTRQDGAKLGNQPSSKPVQQDYAMLTGPSRSEPRVGLGVDFGTSNTSVAYRDLISLGSHPQVVGVPELPPRIIDRVTFSVTAPARLVSGTPFTIDVWAHLDQHRERVIQRARDAASGVGISMKSKGPVQVARGAVLVVRLKLEGLTIENDEDTLLWDDEIANATFAAAVPMGASDGLRRGLATVHLNGLQIVRIDFVLNVGRVSAEVGDMQARTSSHRSAFASYAREDSDEVLPRIQGIQKVAPGLDVFLDVLSLRSGQRWEAELWKQIPRSDIFYLFWSEHARRSEWVEKEWRCALKTKGLDFIDPVPLVSPDEVPPPPELADKHFDDWVLAFRRGSTPR